MQVTSCVSQVAQAMYMYNTVHSCRQASSNAFFPLSHVLLMSSSWQGMLDTVWSIVMPGEAHHDSQVQQG